MKASSKTCMAGKTRRTHDEWNTGNLFAVATPQDVRHCLEAGASLKARTEEGYTPLHLAAECGLTSVVSALIDAGTDPNVRDEKNRTPLHLAAEDALTDVVSVLIASGADIEARDKYGWTPLHCAVAIIDDHVLAASMQAVANVENYRLGKAAWLRIAPEVVVLLILAGANCGARDHDGKTPYDLIRDNLRPRRQEKTSDPLPSPTGMMRIAGHHHRLL